MFTALLLTFAISPAMAESPWGLAHSSVFSLTKANSPTCPNQLSIQNQGMFLTIDELNIIKVQLTQTDLVGGWERNSPFGTSIFKNLRFVKRYFPCPTLTDCRVDMNKSSHRQTSIAVSPAKDRVWVSLFDFKWGQPGLFTAEKIPVAKTAQCYYKRTK